MGWAGRGAGVVRVLSIDAAAASGALHHALEAGLLQAGSVYGELAAVASGSIDSRAHGL